MTYEVMTTEEQYEGKIFSVHTHGIVMPGGTLAKRDIVSKDNAVAVVALNQATGKIALVRQYRAPLGDYLWELPAGLLDVPDEDPLEAAKRELLEETGFVAQNWRELVKIAASPGFTTEQTTIFLAGGLSLQGRPEGADDEESDMELRWVDMEEALEWVREGKIINAHTVAGILAVFAYTFVDSKA